MIILLKFSELFTKTKRIRKRFINILRKNIEDAFKKENFEGKIFLKWDKIVIEAEGYKDFFERIFGIRKIILAEKIKFKDLKDLKKKVKKIFAEKVKNKTFGVRVKRKGVHNFNSLEAEREIGKELVEIGGKVNLDNPDIWVKLEIENNDAFIVEKEVEGKDGFPLGTQGKVLCLVSGGFDSIVAAYLMAKRGADLSFLFFNLGGFSHLKEVTRLINYFWKNFLFGINPELFICDLRPVVENIREVIPSSYWGIVLKRKMFEIAEKVAKEKGIKAIVTGESLGQVSSQTLESLYVIDSILKDVMCLRPLIGFNKEEIINISKKIGTYEISEKVKEYCAIVPYKPVTKFELQKVIDLEIFLEPKFIDVVVKSKITLREPFIIEEEDIEIDKVLAGSIKVDIRDNSGKIGIPFEADLKIPLNKIDNYEFEREKVYIFFCNHGLFSQEVALRLRRKGIKAYAFRGGILKYNQLYMSNM
ncbi:MAG: tRNA uracil 4-sulfurtransferase ThiI [candidate division WOR-3 bacterium]